MRSTTSAALPSTGPPISSPSRTSATLLVYFSRAGENYYNGGRRVLTVGNTEVLAGMIADRIDCVTYRIEAAEPYCDDYDDTVARNVREQNANSRPAIGRPLPDSGLYSTVLIGSPIWNVRPPMIMRTFLDRVNLAGKTVLPFVTYAVSGPGSTARDYAAAAPAASIADGLAIRGEDVAGAAAQLEQWLQMARLL